MAITGRFLADFSDFQAAVQKADIALKGMETGANQVSKSLDKMTDAFSGRKIVQEATLMAQAFEQLASKGIALTNKELAKMGAVADEAIAKLKAGGQAIPPGIQKIADAAAKSAASLKEMGNAFSGKKVIDDANAAVKAVADLGGASKLTAKEMQAVNATVSEAIAKYKALGQEAPKAMTDLAKATSTAAAPTSLLGKTMGDLGTQLKATALGFISAQAIIGGVSSAFNALTSFVSSSIEAFAGAEAASKKVEAALLSQGKATPELVKQYNDLATSFEKTTGFADDLIQEMEALFITVGDVGPEQMDDALQAATDLAAGLGIDLKTATLAVSKALQGNADALKKYGVQVDEAAVATEGMGAVLDAVNAKFGGQAIAAMDTYTGRVKAFANAWDNLKESIGGAIANNDVVIAAMREATDALNKQNEQVEDNSEGATSWAKSWNDAILSMFPVMAQWGALTARAKEANEIFRELQRLANVKPPEGFGKSTLDVGGITGDMKLMDEIAGRLKKTEKTISDLHKSMIRDMDALGDSTAEIAAGMQKFGISIPEEAIKRYLEGLKEGIKATEALAKAQEKAAQAGAKAWKDFHDGIDNVNDTMDKFVSQHLKDLGERGHRVMLLLSDDAVKFAKAMTQGMVAGQATIEGLGDEFAQLGQKIKPIPPETKRIKVELDTLAKSLAQLAQVSGGAFGTIAKDLATLVAAMATVEQSTKGLTTGFTNLKGAEDSEATVAAFTEIGASALSMASAFLQATETGNTLQKTLKGAALGAQVGSQFGAIGTAIGAGIGGLAGLVRGLFGKDEGRKMVEEFAKGMGGFNLIRKQLLALGAEGEKAWKAMTEARGTKAAAAGIAQVEAALKKIPKALDQMVDAAEKSGQEMGTALVPYIQNLIEAGQLTEENRDQLLGMAGVPEALNKMVRAAALAGGGLNAAMAPYIKSLIEAGQLTEANANLLRGLPEAGVPAFKQVEDAAEALGLPIDAIGQSIQQMKFEDAAGKIADHLDVLARAGADMNAVLEGAKGKIQDLVNEAMKTGKSLPEAMRPFLQQMVDSGKLTDIFGDKLTDLEDLHFTKPLEDSVQDLIDAMMELVDVIRDDVGGAIDDLGNKVARPKIQPEYFPPTGAPGGGAAAPDLSEAEAAIREPVAAPAAGTTIIVEMDGRQIAGAVVPHIPGEVSRFVAT